MGTKPSGIMSSPGRVPTQMTLSVGQKLHSQGCHACQRRASHLCSHQVAYHRGLNVVVNMVRGLEVHADHHPSSFSPSMKTCLAIDPVNLPPPFIDPALFKVLALAGAPGAGLTCSCLALVVSAASSQPGQLKNVNWGPRETTQEDQFARPLGHKCLWIAALHTLTAAKPSACNPTDS